jgi:DNA polymerase-1
MSNWFNYRNYMAYPAIFMPGSHNVTEVAFDCEFRGGLDPYADFFEVTYISLALKFDLTGTYCGVIKANAVPGWVRRVFNDPKILKIGFNIRIDMACLQRLGIEINGPVRDVATLLHLHNPYRLGISRGLKAQVMEWGLSCGNYSAPLERWFELNPGKGWDDVPEHVLVPYAGQDALATLGLYERVLEANPTMGTGIIETLSEAEYSFLRAETNGACLDVEKALAWREELENGLLALEKDLTERTSVKNIRSTKQWGEYLFDTKELPVLKKTKKGGRSVDDDAIQKLKNWMLETESRRLAWREQAVTLDLLLKYRKNKKKIEKITDLLTSCGVDGIIHTKFNINGTLTGRTSCGSRTPKAPNLQNLERPKGSFPIRELLVSRYKGET